MEVVFTFITGVMLLVLLVCWKMFVVVEQHETVLKERLGKFAGILKPGFHFMTPFLDRAAYRQEMREQVLDVPSQACITKDNIQVEVDGVVYLKVVDAQKASYGIGDYRRASVNLAQTTMRSEIGKLSLDDTFSERDVINENIVREIDKASDPWGVKVTRYEIMNISPSSHVIETMEQQMEAERQKRAEITMSEGQMTAKINMSEGEQRYAINMSEGERERRINEAEGQAEAIRILADAAAEGASMVAEALRLPGGDKAGKVRLLEQYLAEMAEIIDTAQVDVLPLGAAQTQAVMEGIAHIVSPVKGVRS